MPLLAPWPLFRQALVRTLRANLVLADGLPGDWSEGSAPPKTPFPHGTYSQAYSVPEYDWSGVVNITAADVVVFSKDTGEAASLAQSVLTTLQDARLAVTGLTTLSLRRVGDISLTDVDETGNKVYTLGFTFAARLEQARPEIGSLTVTVNSTIS